METDLSRSCADLKGVGGLVGGGRWWKIQFFYSSDHHMANINTPPRKKKILDPRMIVCIFFPHYDAMHGKCATDTLHAS